MTHEELGRALALVLVRFSAQARGRLMQILPESLRDRVVDMLENAEGLAPADMCFVEQVLHTDLETIFAEEEEAGERLLAEVWPLQVSDLMALVLLHAPPQEAAGVLLQLPPALQGETLYKLVVQHWDALERRLGRAEVVFLRAVEEVFDAPPQKADPAFAADLLRRIQAPGAVRRLLTEMYRLDPEPTGQVQDLVYRFEDLVRLNDLEFQMAFFGVDPWDLALAFRSAPAGLRQRLLTNISERRASYLAEDEGMLDEVEEEEVEAVRRRIVARVRRFYEEGKILTYFGSVGVEEAEEVEEDDEETSGALGKRSGASAKPLEKRRDLRGVAAGLAGAVLAVLLLVWLGGTRSGSRSSGGASARGALMGDSDVQREGFGGFKKGRGQGGRRGGGGSSDLVLVVGNVRLNSGDSKRPASGETLRPGDWVETDAGGQAVLRLGGDAGQVQVEASSAVQVGEEGQERDRPPQLSIRLGNVWVYVKHPALEVRSPLAEVTASEGALYRLRVVLDATTTVSVQRGTVWVKPLVDEAPEFLVLGPEEGVRIYPSGRVVSETEAPESEWLGIF